VTGPVRIRQRALEDLRRLVGRPEFLRALATADLVVDTSSMTHLGVRGLKVQDSCSVGTSGTVWHFNYFRQQKSIDFIRSTFRV
jgi:hypothetical protein